MMPGRERRAFLRLFLLITFTGGFGYGVMLTSFGVPAVWTAPALMLALAWLTWTTRERESSSFTLPDSSDDAHLEGDDKRSEGPR